MGRTVERIISTQDQAQSGAHGISKEEQASNAAAFREIIRALGHDSNTFQSLSTARTSRRIRPTMGTISDPPSPRTRRRVQE